MNTDLIRRIEAEADEIEPYDAHLTALLRKAATALASQQWQPIETVPEDQTIDIIVLSKNNPTYWRRACDMSYSKRRWYGIGATPVSQYGEYAAYWMPLPPAPKENSK